MTSNYFLCLLHRGLDSRTSARPIQTQHERIRDSRLSPGREVFNRCHAVSRRSVVGRISVQSCNWKTSSTGGPMSLPVGSPDWRGSRKSVFCGPIAWVDRIPLSSVRLANRLEDTKIRLTILGPSNRSRSRRSQSRSSPRRKGKRL